MSNPNCPVICRAYIPPPRNIQHDEETGRSHDAIYRLAQEKPQEKPKSNLRAYLSANKFRLMWAVILLLLLLVLCLIYKTTILPGSHAGRHTPVAPNTATSAASSTAVSLATPSAISPAWSPVSPSQSTSDSAASTTAPGVMLPILLTSPSKIVVKHIDHSHDHNEPIPYNLPLHVAAIFILLISSSLSCLLPFLAKNFLASRISTCISFAARHSGTGVLLATAFVHLFPTAFSALTHPSLPAFFTKTYSCLPGAIVLGAILVILALEMLISPHRVLGAQFSCGCVHAGKEESGDATAKVTKFQQIMQCRMLEGGVIFHSIFIGMTLSVASGPGFVAFMVTIMLHQAFEGLALGSRISVIEWPSGSVEPWIMISLYGLTTPIGQAVGLAIRSLYSPKSPAGLFVVGFSNAVSAGLLIFAALTEIIPNDFLSPESWKTLQGWHRVLAYGFVVLGAGTMSLVGYWV